MVQYQEQYKMWVDYQVFDGKRNGAYWEYWGEITEAMERIAKEFFEKFGYNIKDFKK